MLSRSTSAGTAKSYQVEKSEGEWLNQLGPQRHRVMRHEGTERPHSSEFDSMYPEEGYFKCIACGYPLYTASSKFRSTCGWPCFDQVIFSDDGCHVGTKPVMPPNMYEIVCNSCGSHLGHVFYGEKCTPKNERH
mmetsp:Transcript_88832/g.176621  ORF Transcript_88832/g.176621 Transcript_88832/m.176621 type:complete len:134 (-) Transcript_88832:275-676(-)